MVSHDCCSFIICASIVVCVQLASRARVCISRSSILDFTNSETQSAQSQMTLHDLRTSYRRSNKTNYACLPACLPASATPNDLHALMNTFCKYLLCKAVAQYVVHVIQMCISSALREMRT
jgi:hypothetical protein